MQEAKDLSMISGRLKGLVEAVKSKKILTLIIEPTAKCDLACSFCSMHNGDFPTEDSKIDMSLETWGIVLDSIKSVPYKFNNIGFHGYGEPLLNKNIYRMLEDVRPYCETLKIITNGTALNLSNHRRLLDSGVDEVHVSLDVADRESFKKIKEKDQYERVLKNTIDGSALYSDSGTSQLFIKISLLSPNLEDWQRELILIVEEEAHYFMPQIRTKVMNEGWASYWHYRLMHELELDSGMHIPFLKTHNEVVRPHPGKQFEYIG